MVTDINFEKIAAIPTFIDGEPLKARLLLRGSTVSVYALHQGKIHPHVPRPHVPQNEKLALYSGIFLYVPSMYPYTIAWGLISHVP